MVQRSKPGGVHVLLQQARHWQGGTGSRRGRLRLGWSQLTGQRLSNGGSSSTHTLFTNPRPCQPTCPPLLQARRPHRAMLKWLRRTALAPDPRAAACPLCR